MTDHEMLEEILDIIKQLSQDVSHLKETVNGIEWALTNVTNRNLQMITEEYTTQIHKTRKNEETAKDLRSKLMEHEVLLQFLKEKATHFQKKE